MIDKERMRILRRLELGSCGVMILTPLSRRRFRPVVMMIRETEKAAIFSTLPYPFGYRRSGIRFTSRADTTVISM